MARKDELAQEISLTIPTFIRHMYPYVFAPISVPPSQVLAIVAIEERGGCTLSQLREEMHVSAPTITGIIDRLVRDGYVKRTPDLKDRRVKNVMLTKKGESLLLKFRGNIKKRWDHILTRMPVKEAEAMVNILKHITRGFMDGSI